MRNVLSINFLVRVYKLLFKPKSELHGLHDTLKPAVTLKKQTKKSQ